MMKVSTLAYCSVLMLAKMTPRKARATGANALTLPHSSASTVINPAAPTSHTDTAADSNCAKRTSDGTGSTCTATLLHTSMVAEHTAYPATAKATAPLSAALADCFSMCASRIVFSLSGSGGLFSSSSNTGIGLFPPVTICAGMISVAF